MESKINKTFSQTPLTGHYACRTRRNYAVPSYAETDALIVAATGQSLEEVRQSRELNPELYPKRLANVLAGQAKLGAWRGQVSIPLEQSLEALCGPLGRLLSHPEYWMVIVALLLCLVLMGGIDAAGLGARR